jgi:translation initiation factor 1
MKDDTSRLVYSTDRGRIKQTSIQTAPSSDGIIRIRRETKGRKGSGVTTVTGFALNSAELKILAKQLKQRCSTGGTVKQGIIEIQGDQRDLVKKELEQRGYNVKLSGG